MASASRFLPLDLAPGQPFAVIAGKGRYPALLVESARARGAQVRLVSFEEETDPALIATFAPAEHRGARRQTRPTTRFTPSPRRRWRSHGRPGDTPKTVHRHGARP